MKTPLLPILALVAAAGGAAHAQQPVQVRSHCMNVGANPPEPLGDRPQHAVQVSHYVCRIEGGPMDGAVLTGTNLYEWEGPNAVFVAGHGVARKPGSTAVVQSTEGRMALQIADGKVTGFRSSGKGVVRLGVGDAAALQGRTHRWEAAPTGPTTFTITTIYD